METAQITAGFLDHPDDAIRREACLSLASLRETSIVPQVATRLSDPEWEVRFAAIEALARLGDAQARDGLSGTAGDRDPEVRATALGALCRLGGEARERALPELLGLLKHIDPLVRQRAMWAVDAIRDPSLAPAIVPLLGDIEECPRPEDIPALLKNPEARERKKYIAETAFQVIVRLDNKSVAPDVARFLANDFPAVRYYAARTLGFLGERSVAPLIVPLLADRAGIGEVRMAAGLALAQLQEKKVIPEVLKMMHHPFWEARLAAVQLLNDLGDPAVMPEVIWLLQAAQQANIPDSGFRQADEEKNEFTEEGNDGPFQDEFLVGICMETIGCLGGDAWPVEWRRYNSQVSIPQILVWWDKHRADWPKPATNVIVKVWWREGLEGPLPWPQWPKPRPLPQ